MPETNGAATLAPMAMLGYEAGADSPLVLELTLHLDAI